MSKSLVIVESPAKAKTINKYLGSQYVVKSSVGHICDLPTAGSSTGEKAKPVSTKGLSAEEKNKIKAEKDRAALVKRMGIDPYDDWKANYQILPGKEKVVAELKSLAKNLTMFISQPTWIEKERLSRGIYVKSLVAMIAVLAELYLMRLRRKQLKKHSSILPTLIWIRLMLSKPVVS